MEQNQIQIKDANRVIQKLTMQAANLIQLNALLSAKTEELEEENTLLKNQIDEVKKAK
ncbi:hypothetical protein GJU40_01480 [Bacillus lacus]|uniref:Uncharacterized protein n=1 Tax=Metabacillus lacus TaxID=1983721 RepID=A0A7X2LYF5_9BACI|nr:hypothetical protein [Metabacillus lacus]MRX70837.1 hypothetical protein [Metabacillus lacus]